MTWRESKTIIKGDEGWASPYVVDLPFDGIYALTFTSILFTSHYHSIYKLLINRYRYPPFTFISIIRFLCYYFLCAFLSLGMPASPYLTSSFILYSLLSTLYFCFRFLFFPYLKYVYLICAFFHRPRRNWGHRPDGGVQRRIWCSRCSARCRSRRQRSGSAASGAQPLLLDRSASEHVAHYRSVIPTAQYSAQLCQVPRCIVSGPCSWLPQWNDDRDVVCKMQPHRFKNGRCYCRTRSPNSLRRRFKLILLDGHHRCRVVRQLKAGDGHECTDRSLRVMHAIPLDL